MSEPPFILNERLECNIKVHAMRYAFLGRRKYIVTDEAVHASVLEFVIPKQKAFFVMVLTPYPNTPYFHLGSHFPFIFIKSDLDDRYENPSVLFSNDGINWIEIVQNPIFPPPKNVKKRFSFHNSDPCLIWNDDLKKAFLYFNCWSNGDKNVRLLISDDLITWQDMGNTNVSIRTDSLVRVSPTVIYEGGVFYMLTVQVDKQMHQKPFLELFSSIDGLYWTKKAELDIRITKNDSKFYPWHITLRKVGNNYWMLSSMNHGNLAQPPMYLFLMKSKNLLEWTPVKNPVLEPKHMGLDNMIYHGDLVVNDKHIMIWYSDVSTVNKYKIRMAKGKLLNETNIQSSNVVVVNNISDISNNIIYIDRSLKIKI